MAICPTWPRAASSRSATSPARPCAAPARSACERVIFVGMAGKLTKLAAGVLMTHYTRSAVDRELLAAVTAEAGGDAELAAAVAQANTARHAYEIWESRELLRPAGEVLCRRVRDVIERFTEGTLTASVVMVDPQGHGGVASSEPA